ncbi:hypothetical protein AFK16_000931 [Salmonella enterica subsp. enterica]|nr:hypothetical protein [Salmonella enterica subsp. enterica]
MNTFEQIYNEINKSFGAALHEVDGFRSFSYFDKDDRPITVIEDADMLFNACVCFISKLGQYLDNEDMETYHKKKKEINELIGVFGFHSDYRRCWLEEILNTYDFRWVYVHDILRKKKREEEKLKVDRPVAAAIDKENN